MEFKLNKQISFPDFVRALREIVLCTRSTPNPGTKLISLSSLSSEATKQMGAFRVMDLYGFVPFLKRKKPFLLQQLFRFSLPIPLSSHSHFERLEFEDKFLPSKALGQNIPFPSLQLSDIIFSGIRNGCRRLAIVSCQPET